MRRLLLACCAVIALAPAAAFADAQITIVNINGPGVGFNDATPAAPVGSNPGTTLGAQRLFAFQTAADIWGSTLDSSVEIFVNAQMTPLTCTSTSAVLGSAGATTVHGNFANAPLVDTFYPQALANSLAAVDLDAGNNDINANFNSNLGQPGCLDGSFFYLGADNSAPAGQIDMVVVLLHEFAHGLGFATFVNKSTGAELGGIPDAYEAMLVDDTTGLRWTAMNDAQRLASIQNTRRVVLDGAETVGALPGVLVAGTPLLQATAPAGIAGEYLIGTASFGTPLGTTPVSGPVVLGVDGTAPANDGCEPLTNGAAVSGKIALVDRGLCGFTVKALNAQNAGAIAVIIADNAAGSPPLDLGGSDPSVTIPAVRITQADGTLFKANLGTLAVSLFLDATRRLGADALGRPLVYTPVPIATGSSVSHFDTSAFANLLMEPAINADLTYGLDLTKPFFVDLGWVLAAPTISISDVSQSEGNSGTTNATFTVSLSHASGQTITVKYQTANGTAAAGSDYTAKPLTTLTFTPGQTTKSPKIVITGDTRNENDETYFVNLSAATNAVIADAQGKGTIVNDDPVPTLSVADKSVTEGDTGSTLMNFTVTLSAASGKTVTVQYTTVKAGTGPGFAKTAAPADYVKKSGTLTFAPGITSMKIPVTILGDTASEGSEIFWLNLSSPVKATISDAQAVGTILDNE